MTEDQDPVEDAESAVAPSPIGNEVNAGATLDTAQSAPVAREPHWYREAIKHQQRENRDLKRQLDEISSRQVPEPQYHPEDMGYDPYSYADQVRDETLYKIRLENSEDRFVDKHGTDALRDVDAWLRTRPDLCAVFNQKRDPWKEAYKHYTQEQLMAEVGDDPSAYRERVRAELLAELNHQGAMQPRQQTRLPPNSSGQRSAGFTQRGDAGPTPLNQIFAR